MTLIFDFQKLEPYDGQEHEINYDRIIINYKNNFEFLKFILKFIFKLKLKLKFIIGKKKTAMLSKWKMKWIYKKKFFTNLLDATVYTITISDKQNFSIY